MGMFKWEYLEKDLYRGVILMNLGLLLWYGIMIVNGYFH